MNAPVTIQLKNDLLELERVSQVVEAFGQAHDLPHRTVFELNLALDEILTNIMSYGYRDTAEHEIVVRLAVMSRMSGEIVIEVEDDAEPFDPTTVAEPDLDLPLEARPVGGLGIHLVRKLMDGLAYTRQPGRNVLSMRKVLERAARRASPAAHAAADSGLGGAPMDISETKRSGAVVVSVAGRVDASNAAILEQRLLGLIDGGERRVVVDCAALDYISSAGLRALLVAVKRIKGAGGQMALGSLKDDIREVFDIAGFSAILSVYPNPDAALAKM